MGTNVQHGEHAKCEAQISDREEGIRYIELGRVRIEPFLRRCRNRPRYRVNGRNVCAVHRKRAGTAE